VIPALKNKDWRELARKRKQLYVPPSAAAQTGADGSVGGLGTRDTINSGPQVAGLQTKKRVKLEEDAMDVEPPPSEPIEAAEAVKKEEETEDQKALRAILASAENGGEVEVPAISVIPTPSEDDVYKQDVAELPESASLEDYERVPVSQFGAALLRGMGWKEGTAASKKNKGIVEPWLPQSRPALLGIGAKEREVFDDGSKKKGGRTRPEKRYVPVVKRERQREDGPGSGSRTSSRRRSPSQGRSSSKRPSRTPSPDRRRDRDRERDRRSDYDRDGSRSKDKDGERDRARDSDRYRDKDRERDRNREPERDRDRRRDDRADRSGERDRDRHDSDGRRREKDRSRY